MGTLNHRQRPKKSKRSLSRGGSYRTFLELAKYYKWKSMSLQIRIMDIKRFFENSTSLTLHRGSENLKIPIIGSKMKVVVNFIYGYQNLSGEKCKTNKERISSIGLTSLEKNPKNHPKTLFFRKVTFRVVFWTFLLNGKPD